MIHFGGVGVSGVLILDSECAQPKAFYPSSFERVEYYLKWLVEQSGVSSMLRVIPVHRDLAQSLGLDIIVARGSGFAMLKYV